MMSFLIQAQGVGSALLLAQEDGGASRVVLPAPDELIFGTIAFFAFFLLMQKKVFPALRATLAAREQAIRDDLSKAEQTRTEAEADREAIRAELAQGHSRADDIVRTETAAAEARGKEIVARAEREASEIVAKAREEALSEKGRVFADLRSQVADLSLDAAQKVLQKELSDPAAQRALVDEFISAQAGK